MRNKCCNLSFTITITDITKSLPKGINLKYLIFQHASFAKVLSVQRELLTLI